MRLMSEKEMSYYQDNGKYKGITIILFMIIVIALGVGVFNYYGGMELFSSPNKKPFQRIEDKFGETTLGEENREYFYKQIEERYDFIGGDSEKCNISKQIDYLLVEYKILLDSISQTDHYVFVNSHCSDLLNVESDLYYSEVCVLGKELEDKIKNVNYAADEFNTDGRDKDYGIGYRINLWWYSLGKYQEDFRYLFDNIEYKTDSVNKMITEYNEKHKGNLNTIYYIKPTYENNDMYDKKELKDHYDNIIEYYSSWEDPKDIYPQRIRERSN